MAASDLKEWMMKLPVGRKRISASREWKLTPKEKQDWQRAGNINAGDVNSDAMRKRFYEVAQSLGVPTSTSKNMDVMDLPSEWWDNQLWRLGFENYIDGTTNLVLDGSTLNADKVELPENIEQFLAEVVS